MSRLFTVGEARDLLPAVLERAAELIGVRADLAELSLAIRRGVVSPLGGRPEAKAAEAQLSEHLGWFTGQGLEIKGVAPLLLDFPADLGAGPVLLCWSEGEPGLVWWHHLDLGYAGRRPL